MAADIIKRLILVAVVAAVVSVLSYLIGRRDGRIGSISDFEEKVDTLFIFDTITQYEPIVEERVKLEKILVPVAKTDTLWRTDTLLVYLEREQVIWQDSMSRVYASGVLPQVDSVEHFITERVIERNHLVPVVRPARWGIGFHVGYGVPIQGRPSPYVGIGVSYNLLSW